MSESDTPTTRLPAVSVPTPPALDDPGKVAQVMNPPVSPTGVPVLGQVVVRVVAVVTTVATALVAVLPENTLGYRICVAILGVGAVFGNVSQGVRKGEQVP